ncbi:hypothetical protein ABFX02_13G106400 [Erythranthe guttata]
MEQNPSSSSFKADRKTIEKNRRNQMKDLYNKLTSLVPRPNPRELVSLPDQLEGAANYIQKLQHDLEKMKQKKNCLLMGTVSANSTTTATTTTTATNKSSISNTDNNNNNNGGINLPDIDVRVTGSALEVVVITGQNSHFMFSEIIRMLHEEEGAEVVNASFSMLQDSVFHTLHCKIGECLVQDYDGAAAARISEKLRKFVYEVN